MGIAIQAIEYYLPNNIVSNQDLEKQNPNWKPEKIFNLTGVRERRIVADNETAVDLAEMAAKKLIENNRALISQIDFLIFCTQSPDYILPTSACILQDRLGLSTSCGALDFNLGCSGYIYGLAIAKGLIYSNVAKNILLITAETYSKYINPRDKSVRTLFGDGASASYVSSSEDQEKFIGEFVLGTDGKGGNNLIVPAGGSRLFRSEETQKEVVDENGNYRSQNNLFMSGTEIFNFTLRVIPELVRQTLCKNKLSINDIDYFIFHQANKYVLDHLRKKIGISSEKFYINVENIGNTVSSTIPIGLKDAFDKGYIKNGDKIMLVGFGVGYSWGAAIVQV